MRSVPTKRAVYPASTRPGLDASGERISRSSPTSAVSSSSCSGSPLRARRSPTLSRGGAGGGDAGVAFTESRTPWCAAPRGAGVGSLSRRAAGALSVRWRRPAPRVIGSLGLRDVDAATGHMDRDLDSRFAMIFGEDYLRMMGASRQLHDLLDELPGVRAQIVIDLGVARGDGDPHSACPFAFGNCCLDMR